MIQYYVGDFQVSFSHIKPSILRCVITKNAAVKNDSWLVEKHIFSRQHVNTSPQSIQAIMRGKEAIFHFQNRELFRLSQFTMDETDVVRYFAQGEAAKTELVETVDGQRARIGNLRPTVVRKAYTASVTLSIPSDAGIFGLGQDEAGAYNRRGTKSYLYQHNMRIPMPLMMTDQGYGILFDCPSLMIFDDTGDGTVISFDCVDQIDFYLISGGMDAVISEFRYLTGRAEMLPKWAFGYMQSQERYATQFELLDVAKRYREAQVPLDCVVQDWKTWPEGQWGQKTVDRGRYPDIAEMNRALHDMNVHSMVSIWPNMAAGCADHAELAAAGYLLGDDSTYDAFDEGARALYWEQANRELFSGGFDAWWCDSTEPFSTPDWCGETMLPEEERYALVGGEHKKYLDPAVANLYAVMHARGIYENQRRQDGDRRVLNLTRAGYAGTQKYGVVLWTGDTSACWDELKKEIAKGLNLCMSGIPYWTVDIGAFFVGGAQSWRKWCGNPDARPVWFWNGEYDEGAESPAYRELYARWLQFGAFLPVFRSHGTDTRREIWNFGKPGELFYDAIEKSIRLRYRLMPTIYSLAARVTSEGYTMLRSLLFDFPEDKQASAIDDQFMFGDALLVCPVTRPLYYDKAGVINEDKKRACYLPAGAEWFDFWTGERMTGGRTVDACAGIDRIPLFVKSGSMLFMQKPVQYAMEDAGALELWIYEGSDAVGTYYDDDGISYGYQRGECECLRFTWRDGEKRLEIREQSKRRSAPMELKVFLNGVEAIDLSFDSDLSICLEGKATHGNVRA